MAKNDLNLLMKLGIEDDQVIKTLDHLSKTIKNLEKTSLTTSSGISKSLNSSQKSFENLGKEGKKAGTQISSAMSEAQKSSAKATTSFDKVGKELDQINKKASTLNKTLGILGSVISTALIIKGFQDISKAAIEAVESENLFTVSLGKRADAARKWSEDLAQALGVNAYNIRQNVGILNVMLSSMGLAEDQAYEMAKSMTKLAYDMSSFYNLSHEEAFNKIRAGISGETEPLKQLGIILTESMVKTAAYTNGIAKQGEELTEVQKVHARYLAMMEQTTKAQGDLERTADSSSNMLKRLESRTQDLAITTGNLLLPTIDNLIKEFLDFVEVTKTFVEKDGYRIQNTFETLASTVKNFIDTIFSGIYALNNISFGGFENAFNGVLSILNTASYITAKLVKNIELLSTLSKTDTRIPTENELYQQILKEKGLDQLTFLERLKPENDAKLKQAYALAKSKHVELTYGSQNPQTKEIERIKREIGELEKNWLETQKKLLIKDVALNDQVKKQNIKLKEELAKVNIGEGFILPVEGQITSDFGSRKDPLTGKESPHLGIDIAGKLGDKVISAAGGKVIHVGKLGNYGNVIIIDHGDGLTTLYGHLGKLLVQKGQVIPQGETIGLVGSTGKSTGPHLHFETRKDGKQVDPENLLRQDVTKPQLTSLTKLKEFTLLGKLEDEAYKLKRLEELLTKPESLGLPKPSLRFHTTNILNQDKLKITGLTDQDIDLIKTKASQLYENLKSLDEDYTSFKEDKLKQAKEIYDKYLKELAEAQVDYDLKLKVIKESKTGTEDEKLKAESFAKETFDSKTKEIKANYLKDITKLNNSILEEEKKLSEKRSKIITDEVQKEVEIRKTSEKEIQELKLATGKIIQVTENQKLLLAAKASQDEIAIIQAEHKINQDQINQQIQEEENQTNLRLKEIDQLIQAEKTLSSTKTELEKERTLIVQQAAAQIELLRQEAHQNELERIQKETDAYTEQFEKRLGFLAKILGLVSKISGNNSTLAKISSVIGSYSSDITSLLKSLGAFTNVSSSNTTNQGLFGWLKNTLTKNQVPLPVGTQQQAVQNLNNRGNTLSTSQPMSSNIATTQTVLPSSPNVSIPKSLPVLTKLINYGGGAIAGGTTGYSIGKESGFLSGTLGGTATGALTGLMIGGPIGAAIGGGTGLLGGLFGSLFNRRAKKELKKINSLKDTFSTTIEDNISTIQSVENLVQSSKYLDEIDKARNQIELEMINLRTQEASITANLNASQYKKGKSKQEAEKIRQELVSKLKEQQIAINNLNQQNFQAKQARIDYLKEQDLVLNKELTALKAENRQDPFTFDIDKMYGELAQIQEQYRQAQGAYRDSPHHLSLAQQIYDENVKKTRLAAHYEQITIARNKLDFTSNLNAEHLQAIEASDLEYIKLEKNKALRELNLEMEEYRLRFANNQQMLTKITQYEADRRVNIEKEAQEKIKAVYENSGRTLADLITQRDTILTQFDFQRVKPRSQIIKEQLAEIDKQIQELFPTFVKDLQSLPIASLNSFTPDQLATLQEDIQKISNFTTTNQFNNVINISASAPTSNDVAKTIASELEKLLAAQRRFATR